MTRRRSRGFLRILAFVHPLIPLQAVSFSSAGHELPHTASPNSRKSQRVESRFRLCKINQFRWHAFVLEYVLDGFAVASAANERIFQRSASTTRKIIDVSDDGVGQHQG